jgi:hypothetical protein
VVQAPLALQVCCICKASGVSVFRLLRGTFPRKTGIFLKGYSFFQKKIIFFAFFLKIA